MKINNRTVLVKALVGSHNYNLADKTSDYDWKVFVMPTFEELYYGKRYKWNGKIDGDDYDVKDIRDLITMWSKSNIAYLEILVSKKIWIEPSFGQVWNHVLWYKEGIANNNPVGMVKSMIGMAMEKRKAIEKDLPNEPTNEGYKRKLEYGFDTKQLLHIFRLELMLQKYASNLYMLNNYDCTSERKWLLQTKNNHNKHDKSAALDIASSVIAHMKDISQNINYEKTQTNINIIELLENVIMKYIKENI